MNDMILGYNFYILSLVFSSNKFVCHVIAFIAKRKFKLVIMNIEI